MNHKSYVPEVPLPTDLATMRGEGVAKENPSKPKYKPLSSAKLAGFPSNSQPRVALGNISTNAPRAPMAGDSIRRPSIMVPQPVFGKPDSLIAGKPLPGAQELSRFIQETSARNAAQREADRKRASLSSSAAFKPKPLVAGELKLSNSTFSNRSLTASGGFGTVPLRAKGVNSAEEQERLRRRQAEMQRRKEEALRLRQSSSENKQSLNTSSTSISSENVLSESMAQLRISQPAPAEKVIVAPYQTQTEPGPSSVPMKDAAALEREREEEEAREARRKQQQQEDKAKKVHELKIRASELESNGQIAAALAVVKEIASLVPEEAQMRTKIQKLRASLLDSSNLRRNVDSSDQAESDDPLEALFSATNLGVTQERSESPDVSSSENESSNQENLVLVEEESFDAKSRRIIQSRDKSAQKFLGHVSEVVKAMMELAKTKRELTMASSQSRGNNAAVKFHDMDCAVDPPPSRIGESEEDFTSALFPLDRMMEALQAVIRAGDDARKSVGKSLDWRKELDGFLEQTLSSNNNNFAEYFGFVQCTCRFAMGQSTCACMEESSESSSTKKKFFCVYSAIPPRDRLAQLLSSGLRCCLRRALNNKGAYLDPASGGSYRYAMDDVASVAHTALLLYETRLAVVDRIVLLGKSKQSMADELPRVGEFVEAHKFLSSLFPSEQHCLELSDSDPACFAKLRKYLTLAREFKCEDELVLAPFAALPELVKQLREQANLVNAAKTHVEVAFKRAAKDDKCGQCTCEGARRRRAAALGTWIAPKLVRDESQSAKAARLRPCGKCGKCLAEKDAQVACECCEMMFHPKCAGGLLADFVCSKCVPKFKPIAQKSAEEEDDE